MWPWSRYTEFSNVFIAPLRVGVDKIPERAGGDTVPMDSRGEETMAELATDESSCRGGRKP